MDNEKIDAYLHLIYRSFVEIRLWSACYDDIKNQWWNPFKWIKIYKFFRLVNRLSDAFHNLPLLLKSDRIKDFNESEFWKSVEVYEKNYLFFKNKSYKDIFNEVVNGEKRNIL